MFTCMKPSSILKSLGISIAKEDKREYVILFPFPPLRERFMYNINNNLYHVESIAEQIEASLSIRKQYAGTMRWKMTNSDAGSK